MALSEKTDLQPLDDALLAGQDAPLISEGLLAWYASQARRLPWRDTADPYAIWISEIMLQQTQVETVIPYYRRFLERFPSVEALAAAPLETVLKAWENLGYYARARHLHRAASLVVTRFAGRLPDRGEDLIRLPGIGSYTAGAILSIAFGQSTPAIDGNVRRVISRLFGLEDSIDEAPGMERIEGIVRGLVPAGDPGRFNQALMELGALLCTPKRPACPDCPLRHRCGALALGLTGRLPVRRKRGAIPHKAAAAAILRNDAGEILIVRRPASGLLGSLWKFPGGLLAEGEKPAAGLRRAVREELGIEITVSRRLAAVDHAYTHFRTTLSAYAGKITAGTPAATDGRLWRWIPPSDLAQLPLAKVDRMIAGKVLPPVAF
jgi:A/G-specific adenine glycosylase